MRKDRESDVNVRKVVIADDDPAVVNFLAERCARMGLNVQTATNGLQALIMATQSRADALIVDVKMPEVDGLTVCARMLSPDRKSMEIVVITGASDLETIQRCESFGAYYARKGPDLWKTVRAALTQIFPHLAGRPLEAERSPGRDIAHTRVRILVVDDDPDVAKFLASRLRKCGVDMLYAFDGSQGYKMACKEQPSVILTDYFMPNGDANYLLWRLRSTAETAKIPVFVMSARPLDEVTQANVQRDVCGHRGAERIFKKPLDMDDLLSALQKYCALEHVSTDGLAIYRNG
jgi:CheY-like chemotaxis protein